MLLKSTNYIQHHISFVNIYIYIYFFFWEEVLWIICSKINNIFNIFITYLVIPSDSPVFLLQYIIREHTYKRIVEEEAWVENLIYPN